MIYYEVCNLYEEHYKKDILISLLDISDLHFKYFGILHDRDTFPNGVKKKSHYHLIIGVELDSKVAKKKVSLYFNNNTLFFRPIRSLQKYCRYLTHKDNLEKYQYNDNEVFTNDLDLYSELIEKQITISNTDNILILYCNYVLSTDFINLPTFIFAWWRTHNKLDYYLKNRIRIEEMTNILLYGTPNVSKSQEKNKS